MTITTKIDRVSVGFVAWILIKETGKVVDSKEFHHYVDAEEWLADNTL